VAWITDDRPPAFDGDVHQISVVVDPNVGHRLRADLPGGRVGRFDLVADLDFIERLRRAVGHEDLRVRGE